MQPEHEGREKRDQTGLDQVTETVGTAVCFAVGRMLSRGGRTLGFGSHEMMQSAV